MRRTLILALAVAIAVAYQGDSTIRENIFRPGVDYVYRYESQVLTGIRSVSDQLSGVKIHCKVKLQIHQDGTNVLKMDDIHVHQVNHVVRQPSKYETDILPDEYTSRLPRDEETEMIRQLVKPVKCRFDEGEVRDLKTSSTDQYWSINIKKGILSLLQLKLTGRRSPTGDSSLPPSYDPDSDSFDRRDRFSELISGRRSSPPTSGRSPTTDKTFKVMEMDVNGDCETKYFIDTDSSSSDEYSSSSSMSEMKVIKVKNFDKCISKNSFDSGIFAGLPHYSSERNLVNPSVVSEYKVTGDRYHFLIKKATLKAKYTFRPYGPETGDISTKIVQKLRLLSTNPINDPITHDSDFVDERRGLKMEIPRGEPWRQETGHQGGESRYNNEQETRETIDRKLNDVLSSIYPKMQEDSSAKLMQLNLLVRHVPHRQLFSIVKSYIREGGCGGSGSSSWSTGGSGDDITGGNGSNKKCEILLDILPTIQTPDAARVLIDLIRDGSVRDTRARLSLIGMSLTVRPSPEVVKSLMNLYKDESRELSTPHLRQTVLLSVGTICNKMINTMRRTKKPIRELMQTVDEINTELKDLLRGNGNEKDKIRVLKAMGNTGSGELIGTLKETIDHRDLPKSVRTQAVFALRKMAKPYKDQVHPILMSVVMNKKEPQSIRVGAFVVLKKSQPSYTTLQMIGESLSNEPSSQVKTFIYSCLVNMAKSTSNIPEEKEQCKNARKVLKLIRPVPIGWVDSKDSLTSVHSDKLDLGVLLNTWTLKSSTSGLPKNKVGSVYTTIFGNKLHLLEGGIDGNALESVLRRLVGPNGMLKEMVESRGDVWRQLLKPFSITERGRRMQEKIRNMLGSTKSFEPRSDEDISGMLYGEILGHEIFYHEFDAETLERHIGNGIRNLGELLRKLEEGINVNSLKTLTVVCNSLVMPTPIGIPLSVNVSAGGVFKLRGHVRANSLPSVSDFMRRRPYMNKKFDIQGTIKPSCNIEVFGYMGVDMRWLRTGTAIKSNVLGRLPFSGQITVDPSEGKLTMKYQLPEETTNLFKAKVEPKSFSFHIPKTTNKLPFERVTLRPLFTHESIKKKQSSKQHTCHSCGTSIEVKTESSKCLSSWCAFYPLNGKQEVSVTFRPLQSGITKEIHFKVNRFNEDMSEWGFDRTGSNPGYSSGYGSSSHGNYRTSSRNSDISDEISGGFDDVEKDDFISRPRKLEVFMDVGYTGRQTSGDKLKTKITWLAEHNFLEHQINVQVVGNPTDEQDKYKVMVNGLLRCPMTVESFSHHVRSGETLGKLDVHWGKNGFREKTMKCKLWSLDEETWKRELRTDDIQDSTNFISQLKPGVFRYGLDVEFPQINPKGKKYITKITDFIKKKCDRYVQVGTPESTQPNKITVYGQFITRYSKASFVVKTPNEKTFLTDMPVPCPWSRYYRPGLHDQNPYNFHYYKNSSSLDLKEFDQPNYDDYETYHDVYPSSYQGTCKISQDKMITFDGTPILLPVHGGDSSSSQCDVLLAQDCGHGSTFSVTGSMKPDGRWKCKIMTPNNDIEMDSSDNFGVKINGRYRGVGQSETIRLRENPDDSSSPITCTIKKSGEGMKVKLHESGITVTLTDSNKIMISPSPFGMTEGRLCGLCGNNNYDRSDDMTSLDKTRKPDWRSFVKDSLIPSGYCDVDDYHRKLDSRHQGYCTKSKTVVVGHHQEAQICFSKNPVNVCRKHCHRDSSVDTSVSFVCLPDNDPTAQRLLDRKFSGVSDLTSELQGMMTNNDIIIELPRNCVPNNY